MGQHPFLILFFVMYLLIPLLPALRNPDPDQRDRVDELLDDVKLDTHCRTPRYAAATFS